MENTITASKKRTAVGMPFEPVLGAVKKSGMMFKSKNGKTYRLCSDEYISKRDGKTIFQTHQGWFYPENIEMWCAEIGEGSIVRTPEGETVKVVYIFPNGTLEGGRSTACSNGKSYREYDLEIVEL